MLTPFANNGSPVRMERSTQLGARRLLCVYENGSLKTDSTYAVPRLASQLLEALAAANAGMQVTAMSADDGNISGVENLGVSPSQWSRLRGRVKGRLSKFLHRPAGIESSTQYLRARAAFQSFGSRDQESAVVLCLTFTATILARKLLPKSRIIYWIHSLPRLGQEQLALEAVDAADAVATPSRAIYTDLFQLLCRNRFTPPVWVIPNCIDEDQFTRLPDESKAQTRSHLGLHQNDLAIVHIGRGPEKGLQIVETALRLCRYQTRNVVLVSVGGQSAPRRRLTPHAEVLEIGRVSPSELNRIYETCDLGVVPSVWWENCPLALIEMMSLGLCTIGSRVGGIPEMVQHKKTGLLVDGPNDVSAWAEALDTAMADDGLRQRLGAEACKSVKGRYNRQQFMERWQLLVNSLCV
jgi:glycosyltransferase involved in cell wall biosynthesis